MDDALAVDFVVQGGEVVNAGYTTVADVLVKDGKVLALTAPGTFGGSGQLIDAHGCIVIPGGVDPHCHIDLPLGEFTTLDSYKEATMAALHGGTTTVVDFAIPMPGQSPIEAVRERRNKASEARCDTALHGCVLEWDESTAEQLRDMVKLGVRTVKMFTTYRDVVMAQPDTILEVLRALHDLGGMALIHAEANHVIEDNQNLAAQAHKIDAGHHDATRPEIAEVAAVAEVLATAEYVNSPVYFVHQTIDEAIDIVRQARHRGIRAYTETCPHYLTLDSTVYQQEKPERFVCAPPIRERESVDAVVSRVLAGDVDTIGSDHCCYSLEQKNQKAFDVREMPNGLPGVETRLPVSYTTLVRNNGLSLERFVALFSANPARLNGLSGKGFLGPGADADLVIIDPRESRTVDAEQLHMATDYSPYEGMELFGWPRTVMAGGRVVLDERGFHDPGTVGRKLDAEPLPNQLLT